MKSSSYSRGNFWPKAAQAGLVRATNTKRPLQAGVIVQVQFQMKRSNLAKHRHNMAGCNKNRGTRDRAGKKNRSSQGNEAHLMDYEIITPEVQQQLMTVLEAATPFKKEDIAYEIQDDGKFILISITIDHFSSEAPEATFKQVGQLLNRIVPIRSDEYSWTVVFIRDGTVIDSYFGGNRASPESGL